MKVIFALVLILINFNIFLAFEPTNEPDYVLNSNDTQEIDENDCSADEMISGMLDIFTPEDYEEGKENIKTEIRSFDEMLQNMKRLQQYSRNVSEKMSDFSKRMNSRLTETLMTIDLPTECMASLVRIMAAAKNGELWALKFLEAQPRPTNGIFELSGVPLGNFDQCLSIESPEEKDKPTIYGHYCGIDLGSLIITDQKQYTPEFFKKLSQNTFNSRIMNNMFSNSIKYQHLRTYDDWLTLIGFVESSFYKPTKALNGFCLPSTCSPGVVSKAINELMYPITHIPFKISDDCEYVGKPNPINKYHIISISVLSSIFVVFLLSSFVVFLPNSSVIRKICEKNFGFYINSFSVKRNIKQVFNFEQYQKFKALDGFKAILTFYVILLHNYEFGLAFFYNKNHYLSASYKMTQDYRNMFLPNVLLMDNFFLVSAFLLGNTILSRLEASKGKFNYFQYLAFRYMRIVPMIVCGMCCTFLFELIGDGPLWSNVKLYFTNPCYDKWYKPFLMMNNLVHYPNENSTVASSINCMTITWYSSCEFQLYSLAPIAFLLLYKKPKFGVIWNLVLLAIVVLWPVFNRLVMGMPHVYEILSHPNLRKVMDGWAVHYWGPINYFQTYVIGILLAYVVRHKPDIYLGGRIVEFFIWITTCIMTFGLLYWQRNFILPGYPYENLNGYELHVYLFSHKLLYLSGFCWLIYACSTGRGGFINEALGWRGFKVVDNLTLEIYIMHTFFFVYRIGVRRDQFTYTDYYVWTSTIFDCVGSYVVSLIVALVVTRPFANMTVALLKPGNKTPQKELPREQVNDQENKLKSSLDIFLAEKNVKEIKELNIIYNSKEKVVYRL